MVDFSHLKNFRLCLNREFDIIVRFLLWIHLNINLISQDSSLLFVKLHLALQINVGKHVRFEIKLDIVD